MIASVLIYQRLLEKRRIRQARDDELRGVHMGIKGSRSVIVRFVESDEADRLMEGNEPPPPAYEARTCDIEYTEAPALAQSEQQNLETVTATS